MKTVARWLFIITLPFLLLTASISIAVNCPALYSHGYTTYDIGNVTGFDDATLEDITRGLIGYFNSGEEYIDITVTRNGEAFTLFNERETGHLKDVKGLFRLNYGIMWGTLAYAALFLAASVFWWKSRRTLGKGLFYGGILTLAGMVVLGVTIAVDFDGFFLRFHLLSFANDLWLLNPATDYLIMLFPAGFWFDATLAIAVIAAAGAVLCGGAGWWLQRTGQSAPL